MAIRRRRWLLTLAAAGLTAGFVAPSAGRAAGGWLVVADPPQNATAIVVLGGGMPARALEAARAFQEGWAPEVWITQGNEAVDMPELAALDIPPEFEFTRRVLVRRGVPESAIHVLPGSNPNTAEEMRTVARRLGEAGTGPVIFVTSKVHTRRVQVLWRQLGVAGVPALMRYPPNDPFNPEAWWRNTRDTLAVVREYGGLLNAWAGFPIGTKR